MSKLAAANIAFHYTIIATGDNEEMIYQMNDLGLTHYITLVPGLPHSEVLNECYLLIYSYYQVWKRV